MAEQEQTAPWALGPGTAVRWEEFLKRRWRSANVKISEIVFPGDDAEKLMGGDRSDDAAARKDGTSGSNDQSMTMQELGSSAPSGVSRSAPKHRQTRAATAAEQPNHRQNRGATATVEQPLSHVIHEEEEDDDDDEEEEAGEAHDAEEEEETVAVEEAQLPVYTAKWNQMDLSTKADMVRRQLAAARADDADGSVAAGQQGEGSGVMLEMSAEEEKMLARKLGRLEVLAQESMQRIKCSETVTKGEEVAVHAAVFEESFVKRQHSGMRSGPRYAMIECIKRYRLIDECTLTMRVATRAALDQELLLRNRVGGKWAKINDVVLGVLEQDTLTRRFHGVFSGVGLHRKHMMGYEEQVRTEAVGMMSDVFLEVARIVDMEVEVNAATIKAMAEEKAAAEATAKAEEELMCAEMSAAFAKMSAKKYAMSPMIVPDEGAWDGQKTEPVSVGLYDTSSFHFSSSPARDETQSR